MPRLEAASISDQVEVAAVVELARDGGVGLGLTVGVVGEVDGFGEDAAGAGLAGAAGPGEEVGVGDFVLQDGVAQGLDDGVLADDAGEALGAPFAVEGGGGHVW